MKFAGPLSPDIVFLQLEQQDNGKIKIVVHANKGAEKPLKKVGEIEVFGGQITVHVKGDSQVTATSGEFKKIENDGVSKVL